MNDKQTINVHDRIKMRKQHPCGSDEWIVYRIGADIGIRCTGCDRRVMLSRKVFFKQLKAVLLSHPIDNENKLEANE